MKYAYVRQTSVPSQAPQIRLSEARKVWIVEISLRTFISWWAVNEGAKLESNFQECLQMLDQNLSSFEDMYL